MKKILLSLFVFMILSISVLAQSYVAPTAGYGKEGITYGLEFGADLFGSVDLVSHVDAWNFNNFDINEVENTNFEYYVGTGLGLRLPLGKRWKVGGIATGGYSSVNDLTYHLEGRLYRKFFIFELFAGGHKFEDEWAVKGGLLIPLKKDKKK